MLKNEMESKTDPVEDQALLDDDEPIDELPDEATLIRRHKERMAQKGVKPIDLATERTRRAEPKPVAEPETEPSGSPEHGPALFDEIREAIERHVILPEHASVAITLWAAHTHRLDVAEYSPRLAFMAPDKACGKSKGLEVVSYFARQVEASGNISAAVIYRMIEKDCPTLLIDEVDSFLCRRDDPIVNILNTGHCKAGAYVRRCEGDTHEPRKFSTWAPVAMAGIGYLPDTLASRSIIIAMRRRKPDQTVAPIRDYRKQLTALGARLGRWMKSATVADSAELPSELVDRDADNWAPLLAIADAAGGRWPALARAAAAAFVQSANSRPESYGEQLLSDIRDIFDANGTMPGLWSETLIEALRKLEHRPWCEWNGNREGMTKAALARALKPYEIEPKDVRIGQQAKKGYKRAWFEDAWLRYLPKNVAVESATCRGLEGRKGL